MRSAHLGLAFIIILLIACGDDDEGSGGTQSDAGNVVDSGSPSDAAPGDAASADGGDASSGVYPVQLIVPSCVPPGSPPLVVLLGSEPTAGPQCTVEPMLQNVRFDIGTSDIVPPVTFTIGTDDAVTGTFCPGGTAPCRQALAGWITFDTYKPQVNASGSWELSLSVEETLSGRFDADWCEPNCAPPPM